MNNTIKKEQEYEAFRDKILQAVIQYYPDEYMIDIKKVDKLNGVSLYGINIREQDNRICPTIYLEKFFEMYENGTAFSTVFKELTQAYEEHKQTEDLSVDFFCDYDKVRERLGIKLINTGLNSRLLEDVPHRTFSDLAIVCIAQVEIKGDLNGSILIHNSHVNMWGIDADKLIDDAMENAERISAPRMNRLSDVLKFPIDEPCNMYILSNKNQHCGASVITYPSLLKGIGESLDCDYYVLPSSIHEVIIFPGNIKGDVQNINSMIRSINSEMLIPEEILSDHAYYYNRNEEKLISIA